MKKFFQELKADLQFRGAGPGQKLSESPRERAPKEKSKAADLPKPRQGPTNEAQMAAAAALARLEQKPKPRAPTSQDAIRNQVKKELMNEAAASEKEEPLDQQNSLPAVEEDPATLSVSGIYFICPLTGASVRKEKKEAHLREAIQQHASQDPVGASIMEIHTLNRDREKVKLGVETIAKYLDNIHLHPEEEKYQKIKLQNKVFQERVLPLEGADKFFQAVGFEKTTLNVPGQEDQEDFYVLKAEAFEKLDDLMEHKKKLLSSEPVRAQLDRQLRVFKPSPRASHFELPSDFFNLSTEELIRERRLRAEAVEKSSMLRTKAMREKEEQREMKKYNYTLLRVRFPDGYILQGTFFAREPVSVLYQFVQEALQVDWLPFELLAPGAQKLTDKNVAFNECGLVPSALLTFMADEEIMADIIEQIGGCVLKPDLLSDVQILS